MQEENDEIKAARKQGWEACLTHLRQGGVQIGSDFHDVNGKVIGRAHLFFPAGSTSDDRVAYLREMANFEEAKKTARLVSDSSNHTLVKTTDRAK